jgi:hypothetical protein
MLAIAICAARAALKHLVLANISPSEEKRFVNPIPRRLRENNDE